MKQAPSTMQNETLGHIRAFWAEKGYAPTVAELAAKAGVRQFAIQQRLTALVAMQEGRRSVLLELNPEYASIARHRLAAAWLEGAAQMDIFHDTKEPIA